jgi:YgiT-type zinc finger domain-containing protein
MKCVICKTGATHKGTATVTLERNGTTVIIKDTPADVCRNCGEYYLTEEAAAQVQGLAEEAVRHGAEIEVLRYAAITV